jgi:DNA-binding NarL/FixJ family response regulator
MCEIACDERTGVDLSAARPVRLVIAERLALIRAGLRLLLSSVPGFEVVAEAEDGGAAVDATRRLQPDVLLTDLGLDGLEVTRLLTSGAGSRPVAVVVVVDQDTGPLAIEALHAGALGVVARHGPPEHVMEAVRVAASGGVFLTSPVLRQLVGPGGQPPAAGGAALRGLTERERAVLQLIAGGLSNGEIAARLRLAQPTVKTHVRHLFEKLRLRNRAEAVAFALRAGIDEP